MAWRVLADQIKGQIKGSDCVHSLSLFSTGARIVGRHKNLLLVD